MEAGEVRWGSRGSSFIDLAIDWMKILVRG